VCVHEREKREKEREKKEIEREREEIDRKRERESESVVVHPGGPVLAST